MAMLSITYEGRSADIEVDPRISDDDVMRTAVEVVRVGHGDLGPLPNLPDTAFRYFVIDRFGSTIYLRPKVPFG